MTIVLIFMLLIYRFIGCMALLSDKYKDVLNIELISSCQMLENRGKGRRELDVHIKGNQKEILAKKNILYFGFVCINVFIVKYNVEI